MSRLDHDVVSNAQRHASAIAVSWKDECRQRGWCPLAAFVTYVGRTGETCWAVAAMRWMPPADVHLTARYAGATDADAAGIGLEWTLPKQYEPALPGLGPEETYHDRLHGGKLGIFERTAAEDNAPYLVPQETGNHEDLRWAEVLDAQGHGISARPAANISRRACCQAATRSMLEEATHQNELPPVRHTFLRLLAAQMGVGGDDHGARPSMSSTSCPPIAPTRST